MKKTMNIRSSYFLFTCLCIRFPILGQKVAVHIAKNAADKKNAIFFLNMLAEANACIIKFVVTEISKETYFQKNRLIRQNQSVKKLGTNNFNNCDGWFDEYFG